jgi:large subunit ribosomal protein L32
MPVPKKRSSRSVIGMRRSHDFLVATAATEVCPECGATKQRHRVCASCGTYRGRKVLTDLDVAPAEETTPAE